VDDQPAEDVTPSQPATAVCAQSGTAVASPTKNLIVEVAAVVKNAKRQKRLVEVEWWISGGSHELFSEIQPYMYK
jgi:hypothetical protein